MLPVETQLEMIKRGTEQILPEEELIVKLEKSVRTNTPLRIKEGFDPTAPDIHLGSAVTIRKLKQFQDLGHEVIFLIGDFTGMIGDPSGMLESRKQISREEVLKNAETYKEQVFKILDPDKTRIEFNSRWCNPMSFADVLELASKYTIARLLEREDFAERYRSNRPISVLEFLYPLVQGYDSVALHADVELGGTDQIFNLLVGREIQREYGQEPQVVITMPLLVGTDGVEKMSKSLGNYIGICEPPNEMFGKTMSIPDELIIPYFRLCTDVPLVELETMENQMKGTEVNPRDLKMRLAQEIVTMYHDSKSAKAAQEEFKRVFQDRCLPNEIPLFQVSAEDLPIWIVKLLTASGMASSNGEARRLIAQGGVTINGQRVANENLELDVNRELTLKVGKRRFLRVIRKT
ncbi:MAG: tyrosyl-tRNA synthetase [candidate division Zixibacteria bacterium SM23_81]|nr:MAG: tyrosyl-tRNA synthetase [candidate division Zixibacteria bacterium SM23_81]